MLNKRLNDLQTYMVEKIIHNYDLMHVKRLISSLEKSRIHNGFYSIIFNFEKANNIIKYLYDILEDVEVFKSIFISLDQYRLQHISFTETASHISTLNKRGSYKTLTRRDINVWLHSFKNTSGVYDKKNDILISDMIYLINKILNVFELLEAYAYNRDEDIIGSYFQPEYGLEAKFISDCTDLFARIHLGMEHVLSIVAKLDVTI